MKTKTRRTKKAQIIGQVFIFILAAAIFIMILLYGYKAIVGFSQRSEQVALIDMKMTLESGVEEISLDYGSVKKLELGIPTKYSEICFVDLSVEEPPLEFMEEHPLMYDAWISGAQNVFLAPMAETPINIGKIKISDRYPGYLCLPIKSGKVTLRLEGLGDSTEISDWHQ
jgi:hypothetical protein